MDRILDLPLELAERCLVGDYLHPLLLTQLAAPPACSSAARVAWSTCSPRRPSRRRRHPPVPGGWGVAYAAAKAAFHRVTDMCHVEFAARGIWAFSIAPGLTLTESMRASGTDKVLVDAGHVPAPPEVAGEVAAWLGDDPEAGALRRARWCRRARCARSSGWWPGWPPPRRLR